MDEVRFAAQVIYDKGGAQWWPGQGKAKLKSRAGQYINMILRNGRYIILDIR